jgi:hypothetical protein
LPLGLRLDTLHPVVSRPEVMLGVNVSAAAALAALNRSVWRSPVRAVAVARA